MGKGVAGVGGCGAGQGGCPGPGLSLEAPQFVSLVFSTGVRPQRLPGGPGHQTDAGNWSSQEPHLLLTWAGAVPSGPPTLLPQQPRTMAVGVPGACTTSLDAPSPVWGGDLGPARSEMRPCPGLADLVKVEALGWWELGQGKRLVAAPSPAGQFREVI